jgi:hypothetical protein
MMMLGEVIEHNIAVILRFSCSDQHGQVADGHSLSYAEFAIFHSLFYIDHNCDLKYVK